MAIATRSRVRVNDLVARLDQYERLLAEQKVEIANLKRAVGVSGEPAEAQLKQAMTRRRMLKFAGAGVLGTAGAAVLGGKQALATQGSAVLAGQANTETAVTVIDATGSVGDVDGIQGRASGRFSGVRGDGGPASGSGVYGFGGNGASGSGATGGPGVTGTGGTGDGSASTGGPGMKATGANTAFGATATGGDGIVATGGDNTGLTKGWPGSGVTANGGNSPAGNQGGFGVFAVGGSSSGVGLDGHGGPPNGWGVAGLGTGSGLGVGGIGGAASGAGVYGQGGSPSGVGGWFQGTGTGVPITLAAATTAGPPSGTHKQGDIWVDSKGVIWMCTDGIAFFPLQLGGLNNAIFSAVSTQQYQLINSNGSTWTDMDTAILKLTVTPAFNCLAFLTANVDLFTSAASFNQDVGISISGGAYPTTASQPEAWKESGGFAGTYSPNAAFVETVLPLAAGTTYTIKLQWKANKAGASTIWAGAGPIAAKFSPTRLTAYLVVSQ